MLAVPARGIEPRVDPQIPPALSGPGDGELVRRFIAAGDSAAFDGLVRRHGPMVFGVCRRLLRDPHDADDAFQATFLVLLRKAGSIRPPERVGHWLYGVACRTAAKANSMKLRRREKEHAAPPRMHSPPGDERSELRSLLDVELARMPERYRAPIVMCELDGMSRRDAALALRLAEGTLSSRLSRARDLLRSRLTRRGLALSAGALVAGLTTESASACAAVPVSLLAAVGKGTFVSSSVAGSVAGAVPANVALLAKGVIKAMWISKIQTIAAATLIVGTLGTGAGLATYHVLTRDKDTTAKVPGKGEQKPGADDGKGGKEKQAGPPTVSTGVVEIDAAAHTLTAHIPEPGKKAPPVTLKIANDATVELAGNVKAAPPSTGTLADVAQGVNVILTLSDDKSTITHILVTGEHLNGTVKSVDAAAHTVTVAAVGKDKSEIERTLPLLADGRIFYAGTGKSKTETPPAANFSDLAPGAHVSVSITADRKAFISIMIEGQSVSGSVSSLNASTRSIVLSSKGKEGPVDATFTIAPDANVSVGDTKGNAGSLSEVTIGMTVNAQTSPRDPKMLTSLHARMPEKSTKGEK